MNATQRHCDTHGVFTWTPAQNQSPSTNLITTIVTNSNPYDTINPSLTFTVVVKEVNVAPTLAVIPPQTVNELVTLTVTNSATENSIHSTTIGYGLLAAPTRAHIDANGVFTWMPALAQVGTNTVTVRVTDNGQPPLSATTTFHVVVTGEQVQLSAQILITPSGHFALLTITGDIGITYDLLVSTNLSTWNNVTAITPNSSPYFYQDPTPPTLPQRFYRLQLAQ